MNPFAERRKEDKEQCLWSGRAWWAPVRRGVQLGHPPQAWMGSGAEELGGGQEVGSLDF